MPFGATGAGTPLGRGHGYGCAVAVGADNPIAATAKATDIQMFILGNLSILPALLRVLPEPMVHYPDSFYRGYGNENGTHLFGELPTQGDTKPDAKPETF